MRDYDYIDSDAEDGPDLRSLARQRVCVLSPASSTPRVTDPADQPVRVPDFRWHTPADAFAPAPWDVPYFRDGVDVDALAGLSGAEVAGGGRLHRESSKGKGKKGNGGKGANGRTEEGRKSGEDGRDADGDRDGDKSAEGKGMSPKTAPSAEVRQMPVATPAPKDLKIPVATNVTSKSTVAGTRTTTGDITIHGSLYGSVIQAHSNTVDIKGKSVYKPETRKVSTRPNLTAPRLDTLPSAPLPSSKPIPSSSLNRRPSSSFSTIGDYETPSPLASSLSLDSPYRSPNLASATLTVTPAASFTSAGDLLSLDEPEDSLDWLDPPNAARTLGAAGTPPDPWSGVGALDPSAVIMRGRGHPRGGTPAGKRPSSAPNTPRGLAPNRSNSHHPPRPVALPPLHLPPPPPPELTYTALQAFAASGGLFRVHHPACRTPLTPTGFSAPFTQSAFPNYPSTQPWAGRADATMARGVIAHVGGGSGAPRSEHLTLWISATSSLDWAIWAVVRELARGVARVHVALIAPGAEYRARPSFADGSSAEKPATIEMLQRATAAGEVLFFARIFPTSVLADMVWALESIPFALPDKFWRTPQSRPLVGGWAEFLAFNLHDGWGAASRRLALRGFNCAAQPVVKPHLCPPPPPPKDNIMDSEADPEASVPDSSPPAPSPSRPSLPPAPPLRSPHAQRAVPLKPVSVPPDDPFKHLLS